MSVATITELWRMSAEGLADSQVRNRVRVSRASGRRKTE